MDKQIDPLTASQIKVVSFKLKFIFNIYLLIRRGYPEDTELSSAIKNFYEVLTINLAAGGSNPAIYHKCLTEAAENAYKAFNRHISSADNITKAEENNMRQKYAGIRNYIDKIFGTGSAGVPGINAALTILTKILTKMNIFRLEPSDSQKKRAANKRTRFRFNQLP